MINSICTKLLGGLAAATLAATPAMAAAQAAQSQAEQAQAAQAQAAQENLRVGPYGIPVATVGAKLNDPNNRAPVVVVNGAVITGTDLAHRVALLVATSGGELPENELQLVRLRVLGNLMDETLQMQAATAQELPVDNAQVEARYAEVAQRNFGSTADAIDQMNAQVIAFGSSPASLKRQIRGELAWQRLLGRNVVPFINVSQEEAQERWEQLQASRGAAEYRIGEIFLGYTPETREAVLQNAQTIFERLRQGGNFQAYARQFSEMSTAVQGGDLDFVQLNRLPPEIGTEVNTMQVGELRLIENSGGFSIIVLADRRQVLQADPRDTMLNLTQVSLQVPAGISQADFNARMQAMQTGFQNAGSCAAASGIAQQLGAEIIEGRALQARDIPQPLQGVLLGMQVGQATEAFGTPEEGIRVLMLCGKQAPQSEAGKTVGQIQQEIENERIEKRANAFLRDLRNDADIRFF
uniref:peptidylprolyl isomerase n=1 Tax=Parerythrobacter lutipelagi TaxID=1964208 RepID=UPI0010F5D420|nr:peptidylprolyl isomerase [Parerythrobacter lutipelagi]